MKNNSNNNNKMKCKTKTMIKVIIKKSAIYINYLNKNLINIIN